MIKISLECENIILKILYTEKIILLSTFPKFTKTKILLHHPDSPSVPTTFDSCVSLSSIAAQQNFVKHTEVIISKETKILSLQQWKFKDLFILASMLSFMAQLHNLYFSPKV